MLVCHNLNSTVKYESRSRTCESGAKRIGTSQVFPLQETMEGLERDEGAAGAAYMGTEPGGRQPTPPVLVKQPQYVPGQAPPIQGRPAGGLRGLSVPVSHPDSRPRHEQSEFEAPEPQVGSTGLRLQATLTSSVRVPF